MKLCVRLAGMAAMLVVVALLLITLRTDTIKTGNSLHVLYGNKRSLEQVCCRLELEIAALKNQERMRQEAGELLKTDEAEHDRPVTLPRKGATSREPSLMVRNAARTTP
jgi:hypothetical protein